LRLLELGGACALALRRFDRGPGTGERRGFVYACTAVGSRDGDELRRSCELLAHALAIVDPDAPGRLFDRIVFNAIVRNTDDHLRNHALLHRDGKWSLSPAFDIAPNPAPSGGFPPRAAFALAIRGNDRMATWTGILLAAPIYGHSEEEAIHRVSLMVGTIRENREDRFAAWGVSAGDAAVIDMPFTHRDGLLCGWEGWLGREFPKIDPSLREEAKRRGAAGSAFGRRARDAGIPGLA
jgi:serine/threonine-protein kinase HipA